MEGVAVGASGGVGDVVPLLDVKGGGGDVADASSEAPPRRVKRADAGPGIQGKVGLPKCLFTCFSSTIFRLLDVGVVAAGATRLRFRGGGSAMLG